GGVPIIGPGRPIDTDRYYVIMVDPLGTWGASKPSDGLGMKFPQYSYFDMVQANYRLLRDKLKVARVALVTGVSMGGTQTYVWGVMHPEFVSALMPIGGTTQSDAGDPVGNWTFQLMTAAIESDPVWQSTHGDYYKLPVDEHPRAGSPVTTSATARHKTSRRCSRKCSIGSRRTTTRVPASTTAPSFMTRS